MSWGTKYFHGAFRGIIGLEKQTHEVKDGEHDGGKKRMLQWFSWSRRKFGDEDDDEEEAEEGGGASVIMQGADCVVVWARLHTGRV